MTEVLTREKKAAWTAWRSAYKSGTGRKILRQAHPHAAAIWII